MKLPAFIRWTGVALASGGALTLLINVCLTSLIPRHAPFEETAASVLFLWRQGLSAIAAAFLLLGSVGLYLWQAERMRRFGAVAFVLAFFGSGLLLATEWSEVFLVRTLALRAPELLRALEAGPGPSGYDLGAMSALGVFALGWIALAASTLRAGMLSRWAAALVIAGLFATPLLGAALPGVWGAVVGNSILGSGWFWLGYDLHRQAGAPA